jgi:hypothetical protein
VKRISGLIYEETRGVLKIFLENVCLFNTSSICSILTIPIGHSWFGNIHWARQTENSNSARCRLCSQAIGAHTVRVRCLDLFITLFVLLYLYCNTISPATITVKLTDYLNAPLRVTLTCMCDGRCQVDSLIDFELPKWTLTMEMQDVCVESICPRCAADMLKWSIGQKTEHFRAEKTIYPDRHNNKLCLGTLQDVRYIAAELCK